MDYRGVLLPSSIFRDEVVAALVDQVCFFQGIPGIGVVKEIFQGGIAHGPAFVIRPVFVDEKLEAGVFVPAAVYFKYDQGMSCQAGGFLDALELDAGISAFLCRMACAVGHACCWQGKTCQQA